MISLLPSATMYLHYSHLWLSVPFIPFTPELLMTYGIKSENLVNKVPNKYATKIYTKINMMKPVLMVIGLAILLVYSALLARVTIVAALFPEEGEGAEQASAGFVNAMIFIIVAIIGGFIIMLLFKYRKKLTLKFVFGGALFMAGTFIAYFFGRTILALIQIKTFDMPVFYYLYNPMFRISIDVPAPLYQTWFNYLVILLFILIGFYVAYVITSRRFHLPSKNMAVLCEGAFMGAFLSVILPTWTIFFLLIGLSLYDIYSVRRGPIRNIVELTMKEEEELERRHLEELERIRQEREKINQEGQESENADLRPMEEDYRLDEVSYSQDLDDTEFMLSSMTYGTSDWDLGIGDLVFYSMLGAHALSPSFAFYYAGDILDKFGMAALWLISLVTIIGVVIGFFITIRLLRSNTMLPGLPISIGLGITGFMATYGVLLFLA